MGYKHPIPFYMVCWMCSLKTRIAKTDICVTLPPYLRQVWGYPPIRGVPPNPQNIKFVPIFLLLTSHFMFWTYQGSKNSWRGWVVRGGGGGVRRVLITHGLYLWWKKVTRPCRWTNVVLLLGQSRIRWPSIETTLGECLVFSGTVHIHRSTRYRLAGGRCAHLIMELKNARDTLETNRHHRYQITSEGKKRDKWTRWFLSMGIIPRWTRYVADVTTTDYL